MGMSIISRNCPQLGHEYVGICRSVEYPLVKLVDVTLVVEYQLCVVTFSVNLRQAEHVEKVVLMLLHQCNPWCV